jgi:hypothetical protein
VTIDAEKQLCMYYEADYGWWGEGGRGKAVDAIWYGRNMTKFNTTILAIHQYQELYSQTTKLTYTLAIHKDEHTRNPLNDNEGVYLSRKPWTKLLKFHRSRLFMLKFGFVKS